MGIISCHSEQWPLSNGRRNEGHARNGSHEGDARKGDEGWCYEEEGHEEEGGARRCGPDEGHEASSCHEGQEAIEGGHEGQDHEGHEGQDHEGYGGHEGHEEEGHEVRSAGSERGLLTVSSCAQQQSVETFEAHSIPPTYPKYLL